jgi:probable blue pigment (indigoidine) exporter
MSSRSVPGRTALALIVAAASWGLGTVISKHAVDEVPPLTLLPIQLASSLAVLGIFMGRQRLPFRGTSGSPILGRLGLLNPGLAYALSLLGLISISASLSVVLWALEPILILGLAGWFLREKITPGMIGLSATALAGTAIIVYGPTGSGQLQGIVLTVAGIACCAAYTVIARRWLGTSASTIGVVAVQQAYALAFALALFGAAAVVHGGVEIPMISPEGWLSAIGSGILY